MFVGSAHLSGEQEFRSWDGVFVLMNPVVMPRTLNTIRWISQSQVMRSTLCCEINASPGPLDTRTVATPPVNANPSNPDPVNADPSNPLAAAGLGLAGLVSLERDMSLTARKLPALAANF